MPATATVVQLWDGRHVPGRQRGGLVVFAFRRAPTGLATRRQLRAMGKRPGGQDVTAVIEWRRGRRWAGLYRIDLAAPVRPLTPARRERWTGR
jgi:RecB family exonuclease